MLLGNKPTLFQTTQSRGSNWAIVILCSCSLFFRLAVKSLLNVFSLLFDFLGGRIKVLLNFKQAPLHSGPIDKGFWSSGCGSSCLCCKVMHFWMLKSLQSSPERASSGVIQFHCLQHLAQLCLHCCQFVCCPCGIGMEMVWWVLIWPSFWWLHVNPKDCFLY